MALQVEKAQEGNRVKTGWVLNSPSVPIPGSVLENVFGGPGRASKDSGDFRPAFQDNGKGRFMILRLSLHLPENATYIRTTRLLSRCLLEDMKVNRPIIDDVETIVAELCANVVRHARSEAPHFLMTLEYYEPKVVITVTDEGHGFVRGDVLPVGSERTDGLGGYRHGGFGLYLIESLSDKLDFSATHPRGTTVRVEKSLHYETQEDAASAAERDINRGGAVSAGRNEQTARWG